VAALACSGAYADPDLLDLPYRVYQAVPDPADPAAVAAYRADPLAEFGRGRFEDVLLDWRPGCVFAFRDPYNDAFLAASPLRPCYGLALMPTVDGEPRPPDEIDLYDRADALVTYTDWGYSVLQKQGVNTPWFGAASPAADYAVFRPQNKSVLKGQYGFAGKLVVGMCARNQPRKLFPELVLAFRQALDAWAGPEPLALYLHTSYPDEGFDLPHLLRDAGLLSKTYFTYVCGSCGGWEPAPYRGVSHPCPACGGRVAIANAARGVSREALATIYNLADVYVQLVANGGFEVPALEAAACGCYTLVSEHSGSGEVVRRVGGVPLKPDAIKVEAGSGRHLGCHQPETVAKALLDALSLPAPVREYRGFLSSQKARQSFDYDLAAARWAEAILFAAAKPRRPWDDPTDHTPALPADWRQAARALLPPADALRAERAVRLGHRTPESVLDDCRGVWAGYKTWERERLQRINERSAEHRGSRPLA
jgi:glycosyltransferase involved in cell wall biosynthesis